jgi:hypothetical protein
MAELIVHPSELSPLKLEAVEFNHFFDSIASILLEQLNERKDGVDL